MGKKRSFGKKPKKAAKGKKRRKGGNDWYNDPVDYKETSDTKLAEGAFSDDENESSDGGGSSAAEEDAGEESDVEESGQRYNQLLSSLLNDTKSSLDVKQRALIERVRMEQQGIEVMSENDSEDESSESSEDEIDSGDQNETVDNVADDESDSSDVDGTVQEEEDGNSDEDEEVNNGMCQKLFHHRFSELDIEEDQGSKVSIARKWKHKTSRKFIIRDSTSEATTKYDVRTTYPNPSWKKHGEITLNTSQRTQIVKKPKVLEMPEDLGVLPRLSHTWSKIISKKLRESDELQTQRDMVGLSALQKELIPAVLGYQDVVFTDRKISNAVQLRELYGLHVMNHVFRSRDKVAKHSLMLRKYGLAMKQWSQERETLKALGRSASEGETIERPEPVDEELVRDQGFTRPRALIILPMKNSALKLVKYFIDLMPEGSQILNRARFFEEFADPDVVESHGASTREASALHDEDAILDGLSWKDTCKVSHDEIDPDATHDEDGRPLSRKERRSRRATLLQKPKDWDATFLGNSDDCFRLGISFPNRKTMRLFSDFYQSDIIIASPLGLRLATKLDVGEANESGDEESDDNASTGSDSETESHAKQHRGKNDNTSTKVRKDIDIDFLSSVEVLVVDQSEMFHMQNWQHLVDVTATAINKQPQEARPETDFSRVRNLFLTGNGAIFRQTLLFASHPDPYLNALSTGKHGLCRNVYGVNVIRPHRYKGAIFDVLQSGLPQRFLRADVGSESASNDDDARFEFFESRVLPSIVTESAAHTLVVVPTYFEFVRVRNLFAKQAKSMDVDVKALESRLRSQRKKLKARGKPIPPSLFMTAADRPTQLFTCCSEYTEAPDVTKARGDFYHGRSRVLLTTERFYFFYRYRLRGVRRIVFYGPPTHGHFYSEMLNLIEPHDSGAPSSSLLLYTPSDALALERIVGTSHTKKLLAPGAGNESHVFSFAD